MGRSGDQQRGRGKPGLAGERSARGERRERIARRKKKGAGEKPTGTWLAGKRPVLRFVVVLIVLMVGFNACFYLWIGTSSFFQSYLHLNAEVVARMLRVFGDNATASGKSVTSPRFSLSLAVGCDAIQASAFFVFIVLASPSAVSMVRRLPVLLMGVSLLLVLNLVRIISLYYTGVHFPSAFEIMHIDVWQAFFIFTPLILWIMWVRRTMRRLGAVPDAGS